MNSGLDFSKLHVCICAGMQINRSMGRYVPFGPGEHSKMTEENTAVVEGKSVGKVSWRRGFLTSHTVGGREGEREREREREC